MKTMKIRGLALLLVIAVICGWCNCAAFAEETELTVYITVSMYGEIVQSKDGELAAMLPVKLCGQADYTLDDVFAEAHALYYPGGAEAGYAAGNGEWGSYVTKAWGDESGKFGYQINGGTETISGLSHTVRDTDCIDLCIYKNTYPDTEAYAKFDAAEAEVYAGEETELVLYAVSGYDDSWNMLYSPCADARITVNGEETEILTDAEGKAAVTFDTCGTYVVSAIKTKELNEQTVPAITAPVCIVSVRTYDPVTVLHTIVQGCAENGVLTDGNMLWFTLDMAVYEELYSESLWTDDERQEYLDAVIAFADTARTPGDLAKAILAIRALGYDARKVHTAELEQIDVVSRLTALVDADAEDVTGAYTLPYVILALRQGEGYATRAQMEYLLDAAVSSKESWQNMEYGPDAAAPMLLALAPEYEKNAEIAAVIDETCVLLEEEQTEGGWMDSWGAAASTGLVIAGYSALGIDAETVQKNGNSLIDGLMTMCAQTQDGFLPTDNSFSTEQGLRGLLAWQLLKSGKEKALYDFSENPMEEAHATWAQNCPVEFVVTPEDAVVTIVGETAVSGNKFDLSKGSYTYKVTKSGYSRESGKLIISDEEAAEHMQKTVTVSLKKREVSAGKNNNSGGGGMVYVQPEPDAAKESEEEPEVAVPEDEKEAKTEEKEEKTPIFSDVTGDDWYYEAAMYVYRKGLMQGTGVGFEPDGTMTRAMLVSVIYRMENTAEVPSEHTFEDVKPEAWYTQAVAWAAEKGIVQGMSKTEFAPDLYVSREQTATILYRYAAYKKEDMPGNTSLSAYADAETVSEYAVSALQWAVENGVINGEADNMLHPKKYATRAQMAAMLMRYCENVQE